MEIDEQSDGNVQQFHVAQQLRLVDWQHFFYGLGFHQHAALPANRSGEALPA
jgi:hypothetical protein